MTILRSRPRIGRRTVLALTGGLLAAPAIVRAQGQNGVALVIGNSKYAWEAQLPNVRRDAPDIARRFEQLGLRTELLQDVGHAAMKQAIDRFAAASSSGRLAAFYFAGHGAQWEKNSHLVPIDADLSSPSIVKTLPSIKSLRESTRRASARLLVFDNCRNNPADDWRQQWAIDQGFVMKGEDARSEPNALVLFSTAPGRVAFDGPAGQNSPFAAALLRQLASPSVNLQELPGRLRRDVLIATEGRQVVVDFDRLPGALLLNGPAGTAPAEQRLDRARVVELPNAFAFAAKADLFMPPGLVCYRATGASNEGRMVGAYQVAFSGTPAVLVVLSTSDPNAVEVVWMNRVKGQAFWRFQRGTISGSKLEFTGSSWGSHLEFTWNDANSGSASARLVDPGSSKNGRITTASFSRLDG